MENTGKFYLGLPQLQICNCFPSCFWRTHVSYCCYSGFLGVYLWCNIRTLFSCSEYIAYVVWQIERNWHLSTKMISKCMQGASANISCMAVLCRLHSLLAWTTYELQQACPRMASCMLVLCPVMWWWRPWVLSAELAPGQVEGDAVALAVCCT